MLTGDIFMKVSDFDVDTHRGFLPATDPVQKLPAHVSAWAEIDALACALPKWLTTGKFRGIVAKLPEVSGEAIAALSEPELRRAMLVYSYLTHAYVWGESQPAQRLPRVLAVPFCAISGRIGRPPVLSYASYAMDNWVRLGDGPPEIGNIVLQQNFLGGIDEDWFILIHIEIESRAAEALSAIADILSSVKQNDAASVIAGLTRVHAAWIRINASMERMPEHCDGYIYYNRVRPYIHGWKNNPALPAGLIYEGVAAYGEKPQLLRGETGAQSSIVPTMDALFGIEHQDDPLRTYLLEMQDYMPKKHRAFIAEVGRESTLRAFVKSQMGHAALRDAYNECITEIEKFRSKHLEYAASYIHNQAPRAHNATDVGTGGTPFMQYLKKHRDESRSHLL
jgi:indoleamine 2,3-dioxygenase